MNEISSGGQFGSNGREQRSSMSTMVTDALLGILAAFLIAQLAPWGDTDKLGTTLSVLFGAISGVAIGRWLRPGVLTGLTVALLGVYLVVAMTPVMSLVADRWVRVDPLPADTLDAIVALSAGVKSDSALNAPGADRLIGALELMRAGHARRLVTTHQVERPGARAISSESDQRRLITLASLASVWTIVDSVHTTRDEAVRSAALLLPTGARSIIVVTSPMHTRRACAVFEAVGFRVYCRAARERDFATNPPEANRDRLAALRAYGYERAAMIKYRWKGWLARRPVVTPAPGGSS